MPTKTRTFLRRFVYLLVESQRRPGSVDLHRINMSRFFFNPRSPPPPPSAMGTESTAGAHRLRLPRRRPTMTFYAPSSEICTGRLNFMLVGRDKILATDQMGSAAIYDAGIHAITTAPCSFSKPLYCPVSVSVGNTLYVLDSCAWVNRFEAIVFHGGGGNGGDGGIECLPPPPYSPAHVADVAVVASGGGRSEIWVSTEDEDDHGTYSFAAGDVGGGGGGEWRKQGDWKLPFSGHAEYVPEYKLWFGLSSKKGSNLLCAYNLAGGGAARRRSPSAAPPAARNVWEDLRPPREWRPLSSCLVHLGSGRFCIARLFRYDTSRKPCHVDCCVVNRRSTVLAVFTAVEVVPYSRRGLRMIKHRSECYDLGEIFLHKVL